MSSYFICMELLFLITRRTKLDSQRGAIIATELKNNAAKVARWATQALLASSDLLKIGYAAFCHLLNFACMGSTFELLKGA